MQITFAISTCLIPPSAENASVLTESVVHSDLYFSALTINLLTYLLTLQKKQLKQYIISCILFDPHFSLSSAAPACGLIATVGTFHSRPRRGLLHVCI